LIRYRDIHTIFSRLLAHADLPDKIAFDIGCGTGRHWDRITELGSAELIGCDISSEMLKRLRQNCPDAKTYHLRDGALRQVSDVISGVLQRLKDSNRETEY
jgi:ubiquinone/menaquinone biosynthesis C-methylase UbiE